MVWSKFCRAARVLAMAARMAAGSNGSCRRVARMLSWAVWYFVCVSSIASRLALIWPRSRSASDGGKVVAIRSTRTKTLRSHVGGAGARIAIATATPTKNRLSASEPSSSQREEPRVMAGANWARVMDVLRSALRARTRSSRGRAAGDRERCVGDVEVAVEPGQSDDEAERGAAGEGGDARPGRRELPVEQHGGQAARTRISAAAADRLSRSSTRSTAASSACGVAARRLSAASRNFSNCASVIFWVISLFPVDHVN